MEASTPPNGSNHHLAHDDNEVAAYAEQIANLLPFPMVMQTAIELDLFGIISAAEKSGGRISAAGIADQLSASDKEQATDKLERMLRLLNAFAVVTCSEDGFGRRVYGLAPVGRYFVRDEVDGASFGPLLLFNQDEVMLGSWRKLKEAIMEGGVPSAKAHGMNLSEYCRLHPTFSHAFNLGMFNHTAVVMKEILQHYKGFDNLRQLVDVGGGIGHTLKIIVSKYPSLKGINFDLPHVIERALSFPGIEHVTGDMFESVPSPAEAIFMKWMLHGFDDERCVKILKNCYNSLSNNGKIIVVEHVLEDEAVNSATAKATLLVDALMMTQSRQGRERTRREFTSLATAAGFSALKFVCYVCNLWVIEIYK